MTTVLEFALDYCDRGFSVIPLRGEGDEANRKRPCIESWLEFQAEAADQTQIRLWWKQFPTANVGIVTGRVSNLVVLDMDGPNAAALLRAKGIPVPPTAAVQTGKGYHAFFSYGGDEKLPNRTKLVSDGRDSAVDVRADGGYVVAPPSVHGSGKVYRWVRDLDNMLPLPPELEDILLSDGSLMAPEAAEDFWELVKNGVDRGGRNDAAARVAGYWLRKCGGDTVAAGRATMIWNQLNRPPLSDEEVMTTLNSVAKKDATRRKSEDSQSVPRIAVISGAQWGEELRNAGPRRGTETGTPGIHQVHGLVEGDLIIVAGRPGMGKSTWGTQLTANAMQHEIPTWIVSTEMSRLQWGRWVATVLKECTYRELPRPLGDDIVAWFRESPTGIVDTGAIDVDEIRVLAEGQRGVKLIIVDHLTRIKGSKSDSRALEVGSVARGLKSMAKDLGCTVVALCQLNRAIEMRGKEGGPKRPQLSDLRDSGEIEQEADAVFFLYEEKLRNKMINDRPVCFSLEKFRHGPVRDMDLLFKTAERRFIELALDARQEEQ